MRPPHSDSAGGNAKLERNPNQAVFPLRGKVLNTFTKDLGDIIKNQEIKNILTILGCGIYENFNIKNLRYDKIIFMADADPKSHWEQIIFPTWSVGVHC